MSRQAVSVRRCSNHLYQLPIWALEPDLAVAAQFRPERDRRVVFCAGVRVGMAHLESKRLSIEGRVDQGLRRSCGRRLRNAGISANQVEENGADQSSVLFLNGERHHWQRMNLGFPDADDRRVIDRWSGESCGRGDQENSGKPKNFAWLVPPFASSFIAVWQSTCYVARSSHQDPWSRQPTRAR